MFVVIRRTQWSNNFYPFFLNLRRECNMGKKRLQRLLFFQLNFKGLISLRLKRHRLPFFINDFFGTFSHSLHGTLVTTELFKRNWQSFNEVIEACCMSCVNYWNWNSRILYLFVVKVSMYEEYCNNLKFIEKFLMKTMRKDSIN
jgi:hypothetical protein